MKKYTITENNISEMAEQLKDFLLNFDRLYYGKAVTSSKFSRKLVRDRYVDFNPHTGKCLTTNIPCIFVFEETNRICIDIDTTEFYTFIYLNIGDSFYTDWHKKVYFKKNKETAHYDTYLGK